MRPEALGTAPGVGTEQRTGRSGGARQGFRRDIEGLRAVAILGVVLYHAHVGFVRGGFTGVDDFFVISGFLITSMLWSELRAGGRLSFAAFYGRRIRRLLPASFLVLTVTAVVSAAVLSPLDAVGVLRDGLSCALYVGNYHFIALQTNYLAVSSVQSPFQQYWSLGVEEQFYLVWPLLLLGASLVWRGRRGLNASVRRLPSTTSAAGALAVVALVSFLLSLWLTNHDQPWAFFSLPTRAWELATGGLVAFAAPWLRRHLGQSAGPLGWIGLGAVVVAALVVDPSWPFPGWAALLPVLGTAAVLAAGCASPERGPVLALGRPTMQVLGRVSYSWYLWHWPVLILVPSVVGHSLSLPENLLAALVSLALAMATFVLVENPLRRSPWLRLFSWRTFSVGGALTAAALLVCTAASAGLPSLEGKGRAPVAHIVLKTPLPSRTSGSAAGLSGPAPINAVAASSHQNLRDNPYEVALNQATSAVQAQVARSVGVNQVPANLTPSLSNAESDEPVTFVDGCLDSYLVTTVSGCEFGDESSNTSVVLFGDSHAGMWFPAVDNAANRFGWKLYVDTKTTCPPLDLSIISPVLGREYTECEQWRQDVLAQIAQLHPALVILGVARHYSSIYGFTVYSPQWMDGLKEMIHSIEAEGSKVAVFGPVPKVPYVPPCLAAHLTSATYCDQPLHNVLNQLGEVGEANVTTKAGGYYIDAQPWFCAATVCPVMVDNLVVFRDDNHITATYANFLTAPVEASLALAMGLS